MVVRDVGGHRQVGTWSYAGGRRTWHPTRGRGVVLAPDGGVVWRGDVMENTLHDEGEASVLNVFFREQTNPAKHMGLANQGSTGSIAETETMTALTEVTTPGSNGYARQQVVAGDWGAPALDAGDYMVTAAQKTFGPNTGTSWSVSHVFLTTTATGTGGLLIITIPLGSVQAVNNGLSFGFTMQTKAL